MNLYNSSVATVHNPMPGLRKLHRLTFAPSGWLASVKQPGTGLWGTQFLTVACPDDFHAIRVGFPNITESEYIIPKIAVCASAGWNDYVNPIGDVSPTILTTINGGRDSNRIVTASRANSRLVVAPNTIDRSSDEGSVPAWTWTDWCSLRSAAPDPDTNMRVVMIRHTVENNGGAPVTFCNGSLHGWVGNPSINNGFDYFCGGVKNGSDRTGFEEARPSVIPHNALVNGSFIGAVQFLTRHPAIVGMTTGDSHHQGTSTSGSFNSYIAQASVSLGRDNIGRIPFGWANCAMGGAVSQQFFPYLQSIIDFVNPSYVVLPGWTANDSEHCGGDDLAATNIFYSRLLQAADVVRMNGSVPIWLTPFPRNSDFMTAERVVLWRELRDRILDLRNAGEIVLDATDALGSVQHDRHDGTYLPGLSSDGIHPNDDGHRVVASLLKAAIHSLAF
jgi:hypothetical protein